jgi:hypothetical protein
LRVAELAARLGLPENSDQATCHAKIAELKRARTSGGSLDEVRAAVARMQVKFGVDPGKEALERHILATELPNGRYLLNGRVVDAAEVEAQARDEWEAEHADDDLRAELGIREPVRGVNVDAAARRLLASRGIWQPTSEEYLSACTEVGAK